MSTSEILHLLITYRYLALFPLACIEGPLVSLAVGFFGAAWLSQRYPRICGAPPW